MFDIAMSNVCTHKTASPDHEHTPLDGSMRDEYHHVLIARRFSPQYQGGKASLIKNEGLPRRILRAVGKQMVSVLLVWIRPSPIYVEPVSQHASAFLFSPNFLCFSLTRTEQIYTLRRIKD